MQRKQLQIPHASFTHLVDPYNQTCLLLSTHWIALKKIMKTITDAEHRVKASASPSSSSSSSSQPRNGDDEGASGDDPDPDVGITRWLWYLNRQIDAEHRPYNGWPLWVQAQLDRDLKFFSSGAPSAPIET